MYSHLKQFNFTPDEDRTWRDNSIHTHPSRSTRFLHRRSTFIIFVSAANIYISIQFRSICKFIRSCPISRSHRRFLFLRRVQRYWWNQLLPGLAFQLFSRVSTTVDNAKLVRRETSIGKSYLSLFRTWNSAAARRIRLSLSFLLSFREFRFIRFIEYLLSPGCMQNRKSSEFISINKPRVTQ